MSARRSVALNSGLAMPALGYGTWQTPAADAADAVFAALAAGYRHLDLAKVYGNQPAVAAGLRRALAELPGLRREQLFITSKLWNNKHRDVEAALDDTLAELQLDYLDLYLVHWPVAFAPGDALFPRAADDAVVALDDSRSIADTWKAMTQLPKAKVRAVGVSNFAVDHLEAIIQHTGVVPAVNQIERHPRLPNHPLVDYCAKKGIAITAYSAFGNNSSGLPLLIDSPDVKAVAERLGATPAQVILAWSQRGGHAVIPKSVHAARIRENFKEIDLDDDAVRVLDKLGQEPQRFNIPYTYTPRWDVNVFGDDKEKEATHKVVV